jgi:hypothetical protein
MRHPRLVRMVLILGLVLGIVVLVSDPEESAVVGQFEDAADVHPTPLSSPTPVTQVAPDPESRRTVQSVRLIDCDGDPVTNVCVTPVDSKYGDWISSPSSQVGIVALPEVAIGLRILVKWPTGFTSEGSVEAGVSGPVCVVRTPADVIIKVQLPNGSPPTCETWVVLAEEGVPFHGLPTLTGAHHSQIRSEVTRPDGTVAFCGVPNGRYDVYAGGNGFVTPKQLRGINVGELNGSELVITVHRVYCAAVIYEESDGSPIRQEWRLFSANYMTKTSTPQGARVIPRDTWLSSMAGLPQQIALDGISEDYYFVTDDDRARIENIVLEKQLPGYKPLKLSVDAGWLGIGPTVSHGNLSRDCDGFGTVTLSFELPAGAAGQVINSGLPQVRLHLKPAGERPTLVYQVDYLASPLTVSGIPFGPYGVGIELPWLGRKVAASPTTIVVSEDTQQIVASLTDYCPVEFIRENAGSVYRGRLALVLEPEGGYGSRVSFARAPYIIPFLPAGKYRVQISSPLSHGSQRNAIDFEATHNGATVQLPWDGALPSNSHILGQHR